MPVPVELALSTLLPTVSFLPPELISLATSLLAQSRSKASSLKAEEEIARTYACAHIACRRLANRLNLDIAKPAPPAKPKVYEKLLSYLDSALQTPSTPRTLRKRDALATTPQTSRRTAVEEALTPKAATVSKKVTTPVAGVKRSVEEIEVAQPQDVPMFAMPLVRQVCKSCYLPSAVPHVLVGVTFAAKEIVERSQNRAGHVVDEDAPPSSKRRRKATPKSAATTPKTLSTPVAEGLAMSKYPALIVALFLCVAAKMAGVEVGDAQIKDTRKRAISATMEYCNENKRALPQELQGKLSGLDSSITFYLLEAEDCGWLGMEWYQNVPTQEDKTDEDEIEDSEIIAVTPQKKAAKTPLRRKEKHGQVTDPDDLGPAGLLPGLGTMFQPAVDWLSDERRQAFAAWKKDILKRATSIQQAV